MMVTGYTAVTTFRLSGTLCHSGMVLTYVIAY
uniref:Uncharacterized protein n=1 Tax=Phlebotomus papatasi TaxID=29031 RepID=A0A1B0DGN5_PHLPP